MPLFTKDTHHEKVGIGNYNHFNLWNQRREDLLNWEEASLNDPSDTEAVSKNPKLDSNALSEQMREFEGKLKEAKSAFDEIITTNDDAIKIFFADS